MTSSFYERGGRPLAGAADPRTRCDEVRRLRGGAWPFVVMLALAQVAHLQADAATRTWTGLGDGTTWSQAANWDTGVPLAGDVAVIPDVAPTTVVVFTGPNVALTTLTCSEAFRMNTFTLTLDGPGTSSFSQLDLVSGVLNGAGAVSVSGLLTWTGGTLDGTGPLTASGGVAISGTLAKTLDTKMLINNGAATLAGTGVFTIRDGAIWSNSAGSTFEIQNTANLSGVVGGTFSNLGNLRKTSAGTSNVSVITNNDGLVDVDAGVLGLNGGGTSSGDFEIAAGSTISLIGTHAINAGATVSGAGTMSVVSGGAVTFTDAPAGTGNLSLATGSANFEGTCAAETLNVASGTLGGAGTLALSGLFTWTGGVLSGTGTLNAGGGVAISGVTAKTMSVRTLVNGGTATYAGTASLNINNGATWENAAGATFEIQNTASVLSSGGGVFNNLGTLRKISTGNSSFGVTLNNDGLLDAAAGTLQLFNGTTSGDNDIAAGAAVTFNGTQTVSAGASLTGAGTLFVNAGTTTFTDAPTGSGNLSLSGGSAIFEGSCQLGGLNINNIASFLEGAGTLNVSGLLTFSAGQIRGTGVLNASGGVEITGTGSKRLITRTLNNAGTATITGSSTLLFNDGATWNNLPGSTLLIQDSAQFAISVGVGQTFNNQGTVRKTTAGSASLHVDVTNTGLVDLQAGVLQVAVTYVQTAGETRLAGGAMTKSSGPIELQGGSLTGSGTITGAVNNSGGTVAPGLSAGQLTITTTYTQGPAGTLAIEVGGVTPGTTFDRLSIGGAATLGGTLNATLINGFSPACSDLFRFLTAASRSGTFANVTPCVQNVVYSSTAVDVAFDVVAPTVTTPDTNLSVFADAGTCEYAGAGIGAGAAANDPCNGAFPVTVTRSDSLPLSAPYPIGVTTLTYSAADFCGNVGSTTRTVTVDPLNRVIADVQLGSVAPGTTTRCVTFEFFDGSCPTPVAEESVELTFVNGVALAAMILPPCGMHTCITARDRKHTLRRTDSGDFVISGRDFAADFTATGGDGDDALVGGDLNDDGFVDIIDFGIFVNRFGVSYGGADTLCGLTGFHADISANGTVDTGDFTFVQVNFLRASEPDCCGLVAAGPTKAARASITIGELWALGLESLAPADLNADGRIDAADVADYLAGGRPGDVAAEGVEPPPSPKLRRATGDLGSRPR